MINESKFDKSLINLYNIITRLNYSDLKEALDDNSLYLKSLFEWEIGEKLNYSQLNLADYQQEVIENYIKFLKFEQEAKIFLTYLKAIEHTVNFMKDTEFLYSRNTPQN